MVLAIVDDLMLSSKISATAKALGVPLQLARTRDAALGACRTRRPSIVLIDLNGRGTAPIDTGAALKQDAALNGVPVVGFVSHVDSATIEQARAAGFDRVMARSAFFAGLPQLLQP
jgi:CheY-like chemotaxis protein